jgi:hypothetical protein
MHTTGQVKIDESTPTLTVGQVVLASAILLYTTLWLVADVSGAFTWIKGELRPYLPAWFALVNALLIPVTEALSGLRLFSFKINLAFFMILTCQLVLLGLTVEKHPLVKGAVTIFLFYETFSLIPNWNRRFLERERKGRVLNLDQ